MKTVTNKAIIDYLLGRLSAENENNFLAECFSSDENAERFEMVREDLIENYLRGNLSNDDQARFQEHFLKDEQNSKLFEFSEMLRNHLKNDKQLAVLAKQEKTKKSFSPVRLLVPIGGFAALLIGAIFIWQALSKNSGQEIAKVEPTPTPVSQPTNLQMSPSPVPSVTPAQIATPSPNPIVSQSPKMSPTPKPNETPKPAVAETPTPKAPENPILAFALPLMAKGDDDKILKITKQTKEVILQTPRPFKEFPSYRVSILKDGKELFSRDFEKFTTNDKNQISVNVPAEKFQTGNLRFMIVGKNADGTTEELKGSERFFKVERAK